MRRTNMMTLAWLGWMGIGAGSSACESGPPGDVPFAEVGGHTPEIIAASEPSFGPSLADQARQGGGRLGSTVGAAGDMQTCPNNNGGGNDGAAGFSGFVGTFGFGGGIPRAGLDGPCAADRPATDSTDGTATDDNDNDDDNSGGSNNADAGTNNAGANDDDSNSGAASVSSGGGGSNNRGASIGTSRRPSFGGSSAGGSGSASNASSGANRSPNASFTIRPACLGDDTTTLVSLTSTSSDPDGDALTCSWTMPAALGSEGVGCALADVELISSAPTLIELVVRDGRGGAGVVTYELEPCIDTAQ